jgi:hypothetical protein
MEISLEVFNGFMLKGRFIHVSLSRKEKIPNYSCLMSAQRIQIPLTFSGLTLPIAFVAFCDF